MKKNINQNVLFVINLLKEKHFQKELFVLLNVNLNYLLKE